MILQHAFDAGLERIRRAGCGESKIEIQYRGARNNVGRARARMQVRYLECRRGEIVVAVIPVGPGELGQDGCQVVYGVARQMRIGDVALYAFYGEPAGQRSASSVLYGVAQRVDGSRFTDNAIGRAHV